MQQLAAHLPAIERLNVPVLNGVPWIGLILSALAIAGCGDGRPQRVPVSGQVRIDGKPLRSGGIRFFPTDGRPSTGTIDSEGRFSLSTFEPNDGCSLGNHRVAVISVDELNSNTRRWNVPKIYTSPDTSNITQTIERTTDSLMIELTWGSTKGPIIEKTYGE
jgi:hypothetical protein